MGTKNTANPRPKKPILWIGTFKEGDKVTLNVERARGSRTGTIVFTVMTPGMRPLVNFSRTIHGRIDSSGMKPTPLRGCSVNGQTKALVIEEGFPIVVVTDRGKDLILEGKVTSWTIMSAGEVKAANKAKRGGKKATAPAEDELAEAAV